MPKRAGFWIRVLAAMLDLFVALLLGIAMSMALGLAWDRYGRRAEALLVCAYYGSWLIYTTMEIWTAGTLGKLALGLRITGLDGAPTDPWRRTLRWSTKQLPVIATVIYAATSIPIFYLLSGFSGGIVSIGCFFAANDDHLSWHDQWAGTCVSWKRRPAITAPPELPP